MTTPLQARALIHHPRGSDSTLDADADGSGIGPSSRRQFRLRMQHRISGGQLALFVAALAAAAFLAFQVGREVYASYAITQRAEEMRDEIKAARVRNAELERELAYLRSDGYISQEARRVGNLGAPDERVLIVPQGAEAELPPELRSEPAPPNYLHQWLEIFFGR